MLLPANRLLKSLAAECRRLGGADGAALMGSSQQAVAMALRLLRGREIGQADALRARIGQLLAALDTIAPLLPSPSPSLTEVRSQQARLREQLQAPLDLPSLEAAWAALARWLEQLIARLPPADVASQPLQRIADTLAAWEVAELVSQLHPDDTDHAVDTALDAARMTAYLRDRFDDAGLQVTSLRALMGGFGKQTYLFTVSGTQLDGEYVLRRDAAAPFVDNDCHRIDIEFAMIRAARDRGFPAPEALWVDTEHRLLPGGHFLVMRRSAGVPGGDVFNAAGAIPPGLSATLAGILARLHALPFMPELAQLNESTNVVLSQMPLRDCARLYLQNWRELFLRSPHLPSPAIAAQFAWLLDHLPAMPGRPSLLHGDIGFHNFLFDDGRLTAVLDWEFAHLGDPAEDLAYVRNTIGGSLDWPAFVAAYRAAGGTDVDDTRLHFFQVWGHLRNACAANLAAAAFAGGAVDDLKMVLLPHAHMPMFIGAARALIERMPSQTEAHHAE